MSSRSVIHNQVARALLGCNRDSPPILEAVRFPAKSQTTARHHTMSLPRAVLAVVLLDPGRIAEAAEPLEPADFGDEVNRTIYTAMLRLHSVGKSIDITLVVGELRDTGVSTTVRQRNPRWAYAIRRTAALADFRTRCPTLSYAYLRRACPAGRSSKHGRRGRREFGDDLRPDESVLADSQATRWPQ